MSSYQALRDALASVDRDECDFDEFADAANPATIAALLAERDALQAALDAVKRESLKVVTQIQAERDALAKDAARYRAIRDHMGRMQVHADAKGLLASWSRGALRARQPTMTTPPSTPPSTQPWRPAMSDLVQRLRALSRGGHWPLIGDEAADRIEALETALAKANSQAEHFEREWYLRGDRIEALEAERQRWQVALEGEAEAKGAFRKAEARIEADRAAMQKAVKACALAEHALTFAPESYKDLLSTRHDAVDDLRAASAALQERLA